MTAVQSESNPKFRCILNADLFRRGSACVSKEQTRYYLNGALVEPCSEGEALIVSTNGHALVAIHDKTAIVENRSAIVKVSSTTLTACGVVERGLLKKQPNVRRLVIVNNRAHVISAPPEAEADYLFECAEQLNAACVAFDWRDVVVDGTYPDWRRVIGEPNYEEKISSINFNVAKQIATAFETSRKLSANRPLKFVATTADGPHFVFVDNHNVPGFGVIMPIRHAPKTEIPAWAKYAGAVNAAAA